MAKAILVCGMVASGKSTYAKRLEKERSAVILSCDELMLSLFPMYLGDRHQEIVSKTEDYLFTVALRILRAGTNVILDYGFWRKDERVSARRAFAEHGFATELHYVKVPRALWETGIAQRNGRVEKGEEKSYFIDDTMKKLFLERFEEPEQEEINSLYERE